MNTSFEHATHNLEITITNDYDAYSSFLVSLKKMYDYWLSVGSPSEMEEELEKRILWKGLCNLQNWTRQQRDKHFLSEKGKYNQEVINHVTYNICKRWLIEFTLGNHPF